MSEVGVSVSCLVYNHEAYLRKCLDGFIIQKTNFLFEVLIHDDASTDRSADIIREYEKKYPEIIKPIYQTENQFSKGVKVSATFNYPRARGKYIALCEGDDYWTDPLKLQKQFDAMENNQQCRMCVHTVVGVNVSGVENGFLYPRKLEISGTIHQFQVMGILDCYPFQTSSYFFRTEDIIDFSKGPLALLPGPGDEKMMLHFCSLGPLYYINEEMSCYRMNVPNSMSGGFSRDLQSRIKHLENMRSLLKSFDDLTGGKFRDYGLQHRISTTEMQILRLQKQYHGAWKFAYRNREYLRKKELVYTFGLAFFRPVVLLYERMKSKKLIEL